MAYDRFTIATLADEITEALAGRVVRRVTWADGDLHISSGQATGVWVGLAAPGHLMVCGPPPGLRHEPGHDLERYLTGSRVLTVAADPLERVVRLRLQRPGRAAEATYGVLILELIPSRWLAALVSERSGRVLAYQQGRGPRCRLRVGNQYEPPGGRRRLLPGLHSLADFTDRTTVEEGPVRRILARSLAGADDHLAGELLHRSGLPSGTVAPLSASEWARLWSAAGELYTCPGSGQGYTWMEGERPAFSALRPQRPVGELRTWASASEAAGRWRELLPEQGGAVERGRADVQAALVTRRRQLERRGEALARDLAESAEADELERRGSILLSHLGVVPSGAQQVRLPDTFDPTGEGEVLIDLEPGRAPVEQAARLLKTARRLRRRQECVPPRQRRVAEELARLATALERVRQGGELSSDEEREWMARDEQRRDLGGRGGGGRAAADDQAHPRRYRTSSGWLVLAGRNNTENDLLTHRVAAQEDIWFHASGYAGSHVVLRREGRQEEPGSRTLEEAAAVAAYWSKGRTAKKVPVIYTCAKHVSKARGGPAGLAVVRREKTLMVAPALLPQADELASEGDTP